MVSELCLVDVAQFNFAPLEGNKFYSKMPKENIQNANVIDTNNFSCQVLNGIIKWIFAH